MNETFDNIDREILVRISEGDESAFAIFFNYYYPRLRPFVSRFFNDPAREKETMQETFIRAWLHRDKLPGIENPGAWLYTICSRICLMEIRKELSRRKHMEQLHSGSDASYVTPADTTQLAALNAAINQAIAQMPEARRRIFLLSREDGMKPAAIAEKLSLSVNTVRNTLVEALKQIRAHLEASGYLPGVLFPLILFLKFFTIR